MADLKAKVTKALQKTVDANDHIKEIYFSADGNHWFNVHKFEADAKDEKGAKNNGLYGRIDVKTLQDPQGKLWPIRTPILNTRIVETATREQILKADPIGNMSLSSALLSSLSPEDQAAISKILNKKGAGSSSVISE